MMNFFVLKTSLLTSATKNVLTSLLPIQPVRTAFLYESKHRVNVMKRMAKHGIHNQLGRKKGQVYLWEKLISGEEVVVGSFRSIFFLIPNRSFLFSRSAILSIYCCG